MSRNSAEHETINLALPLNGAYVSAARLTVASVANRMGFDVDEIEDLKVALSEACVYIIKKSPVNFNGTFNIAFTMKDNSLEIGIKSGVHLDYEESDDDMGLIMIRALMDSIAMVDDGPSGTTITMNKYHKQSAF